MKDELPPKYVRPELPFERKPSLLVQAGQWSTIGLEFGLAVVLFFLAGTWLDAKVGTAPWLSVTGALVGTVVGMYLLVRPLLRSGSGATPADSKDESPPPSQDPKRP